MLHQVGERTAARGADAGRRGRPWSLPLEDRVLLVTAYWRTNLTMRQLAPLFGVSKSAADRVIDRLDPRLALQAHKGFRKDAVLIVDGTLVPTRDHTVAEQSKNYRYSTNHQVVIDADTRLIVMVGRPFPVNRADCKAAVEGPAGDPAAWPVGRWPPTAAGVGQAPLALRRVGVPAWLAVDTSMPANFVEPAPCNHVG